MKREIKFRGKTKKGQWTIGSYFCMHHNDERDHIHHFIIPDNILIPKNKTIGELQVEVQEDTVGQFTGLYDKNGKEIYEGDIVLWERKKVHIEGRPLQNFSDVCKIYYDDQLHAFRHWYKMTCGSASGLLNFNDDRAEASYFEVIGNIYDNPELLKED